MSSCSQLNCYGYGSNSCCREERGQAYCLVSSQCRDNPVWQAAVIPGVLFLLAVILAIIVCYKLRTKRVNPMQIANFAKQ